MNLFLRFLLVPTFFSSLNLSAQVLYPDNSLRLTPIWSRVADVFGEAGSVESTEFSPDGKYIVSGTKFDNSIIMWRTSDGAELWRQYAEQEIERVGFSADGSMVASCSEDRLVQVWDAETGKHLKNLPHNEGIDALIWSPTGNRLVTGEEEIKKKENGEVVSTSGSIKVYDMPGGRLLYERDHEGTVNELMFSKNGKYIVSGGHYSVKVWKADNMELLHTFYPQDGKYKYVTAGFSPDGKYLAAAGMKGDIYIWEWQKEKLIRIMNYTGRKIESLTWHPNGDYLLTCGHGPYINIFRTEAIVSKIKEVPAAAQVFAHDNAEYFDFNEDGSFLVSAHQDGIIRLWGWKGEDEFLNARQHKMVKEKQKAAIETKQ